MTVSQIHSIKRETDLQIISEWIEPKSRVLDLGCGRGILLEQLRQKLDVKALGVDIDAEKIGACVKRGVPVYQGDALKLLALFDDGSFDWVILSRTVQELENAGSVLKEALRVGRKLAVGFGNHGYWKNRLNSVRTGRASLGDADGAIWPENHPRNPVSIAEFEDYCRREKLEILHRRCLAGDWKTPAGTFASWRAAYALYAIAKAK
jgi:methionine biosynthesis protein MetW